ncbi:MAG: DUF4976 domain-containing protein, partial [Prolixibacteraceae bacterium]|nr:DUF4976 domain-containing protein [Prolixibacteraceae bacterium]
IEKPDYVEFNSLLPLISNASEKSPYPEIYGTYMNLQRMVRTDKYKLIVYPKAKTFRLYDIENDPLEINDLAQNPGYSEIVKDLFNRLDNQQKTMNDTLNLKYSFPAIL